MLPSGLAGCLRKEKMLGENEKDVKGDKVERGGFACREGIFWFIYN